MAAVVFVAAFAVGRKAVDSFTAAGHLPQYYQGEFGPAVLLACGHGFVNPPVQPSAQFEALTSFLTQKQDAFDCRDLPASFTAAPLNLFQGTHRYLMMLGSAIWRVTGVSWSALNLVSALLAGITAALVFLLARSSMGYALSLGITAIWITSPMQFGQLPHLRDYAKAPFFVFTLCAVVWIALTRASRGQTVTVLAIVGAVLGVGFGFRADVVSYLPFALLAVLVFRPGFDRADLATRGLAAVVATATFVVVATPVLWAYRSADNVAHVAILGLSDPSRDWLKLQDAPYSFGTMYRDEYLETVIAGYSERLEASSDLVTIGSPAYTRWSDEYYRQLITTFPGDMLVRAWAAVLAVFQLPFEEMRLLRPPWINSTLDPMFRYRGTLLSWLGLVPPFVAAGIFAIGTSVVSIRLFVLLVLFGVIVPGMTSIQFHERHVFHLEVLSFFTYGCLLHFAWKLLRLRKDPQPMVIPIAVRATLAAVCVVAFVVIPVSAARAYQARNVTQLFSAYESAAVEKITTMQLPQPDGQVLLPAALNPSGHPARFVDTNVLSVTIGGEQCDSDMLSLTLRYRPIQPSIDFTRQRIVPVPADVATSARLLFPVYTGGGRSRRHDLLRFVGLEVAAADLPCIQSLGRLTTPEQFPLLLESLLLPNWRELPLYEALREVEPPSSDWQVANYVIPAGLRIGRHWRSQLLAENPATTYRSQQVRQLDDRSIDIQGHADTSAAYLVTWPYQSRQQGSVFYVEGELFEGGLTVGIQQSEQWVVHRNVFRPGRFRVALQVTERGEYGAVLANNMLGRLYARITISRHGWLPPETSSPGPSFQSQ